MVVNPRREEAAPIVWFRIKALCRVRSAGARRSGVVFKGEVPRADGKAILRDGRGIVIAKHRISGVAVVVIICASCILLAPAPLNRRARGEFFLV